MAKTWPGPLQKIVKYCSSILQILISNQILGNDIFTKQPTATMSFSSKPSPPPQASVFREINTFHEFAELPLEIQRQIWLIAAQDALGGGRAYQLVMTTSLISTLGEHLATGRRFACTLSVPSATSAATKDACALLGTCFESRKAALKLAPDELVLKTPERAPQRDDDGNYTEEADLGRATGVFRFSSCEDIIWFDELDVDFLLGRVSTNNETIDWDKEVWLAVQNIGLGPKALTSLREGPSSPYGERHVSEVLSPFSEPEQKFIAQLVNLRRLFVVDKVLVEELGQCGETRGWHRWLVGWSAEQNTRLELDDRLGNLRSQFRYILNIQDMEVWRFESREKFVDRFKKLECGVMRLSDSVPDLWVENLGSDEMADIEEATGDHVDAQTIYWRDEILAAAPTVLHYIHY